MLSVTQKIKEKYDLASKTENPDSDHPLLQQRFGDLIKNIDEFLHSTWSCVGFVVDRDIARAFILKFSLEEIRAYQIMECLANWNMTLSWRKKNPKSVRNKDKLPFIP